MRKSSTLLTRSLILAGLVGTVALFVAWTEGKLTKVHAHHTPEELRSYRDGLDLPIESNRYFKGSGQCSGCHGLDNIAPVFANHTEAGVDVNPVDQWRSTMMGNSAKDPFWRAKVSHEVAVNPGHQVALEDKCTSCHAPLGRYTEHFTGQGAYSIAQMASDPLALDGVSCVACHLQSADSLGMIFSGSLRFDTSGVAYGPYDAKNLFGAPMESFVGYTPTYGAHLNDAGLCAGCHTLVTETADLEGNATGDHFVEQATYHEWLNSSFNNEAHPETGVTCQGCHMPRIDDMMVISALYDFLEAPEYRRTPYGLHELVGGNTFMLNLLKNNNQALLLTASSVQFDSTIARTTKMLQQNTLLLSTEVASRTLDTAFIDVELTNLAGHKFPSGYPARRAFVELVVENADGDTLFRSGGWDGEYEVMGHDASWEPHYDVIRSEDQAQIYEMVMSDVEGNKTTVLERAKESLKDNRLAPLGFTTAHPSYDTMLVVGVPPADLDFNRNAEGEEGSGTDRVHYHVAMNGYDGAITIRANVWYQSAPPRWMEEMFAISTPEIETFRDMYAAADGSPVLIRSAEITDLTTAVDDLSELGVRIFPNPVQNGVLRIDGMDERITQVQVFDMRGALVAERAPAASPTWQVRLPEGAGTYVVVIRTRQRDFVERVVAF
ncbi:MAG: T9SS type A sorting domain-containing protein [Flavobacteriales bacterium]|nr:T9SS type A sorting domain-containing protein [Flavobacteriales bacterium]